MTRVDHSLLARVQIRATGENIHGVAQLLAIYMGISELPLTPARVLQFQEVERKLRVFCISGRLDDAQEKTG